MSSSLGIFRSYEDDMRRAQAAFDKRKLDEGIAILDRYKGLLAIDPKFMLLYANFLNSKGDLAAANAILTDLTDRDPSNGPAVVLRASCLVGLDKREAALKILEEAYQDRPNDNAIFGEYLTQLLTERGLPSAIKALRAESLRRTPPVRLDTAVDKLRQKALSLYDVEEIRAADDGDLLSLSAKDGVHGYSMKRVYEAFESIGCNCELGFVQRKSGAEPLSLFRWTFISPENIVAILNNNLDGYESPDIYNLSENTQREFILEEGLYGTRSHTGVYLGDVPKDQFLDKLVRRQGFLKRKFLEDAKQGKKIFTYKANSLITEQQMDEIKRSLKKIGANYSLFIMPTDRPDYAGTVKFNSPYDGVGYISSIMPDIKYDEWANIVVASYDKFVRGDQVGVA